MFILIPSSPTIEGDILSSNGDVNVSYPCRAAQQIAIAERALFEAGLDLAPVYVGDPDGDHQKNGQTLFATKPHFSIAALDRIEETAADWREDVTRILAGKLVRSDLMEECLRGADDDRVRGWHAYVDAVFDFAEQLGRLEAA